MTAIAASRPQHLDALALADEVRLQRSADRRAVRSSRVLGDSQVALAEILEQPIPHHLRTLNVEAFLMWAYRMNLGRASRYLTAAQASPYRRLGQLTDRQRHVLASALRVPVEDLDAWRLRQQLHGLGRQEATTHA